MTHTEAEQPPCSVINLRNHAQISHHSVASATELLGALKQPNTPERRSVAAQMLQEAEMAELADLLVGRVLGGRELHEMLSNLSQEGAIRQRDPIEWSERFA